MTNAPAILDPRAAWLKERRSLLTASDCAAVLGVSPFEGPAAVWAKKVGEFEDEDTPRFRRGRRLEPVVAEEYAEATGRLVTDPGAYIVLRHRDVPWLGATLDRVTSPSDAAPAPGQASGEAPLQIKTVGRWSAHEWDDNELPLYVGVQVQVEVAVAGATWGSAAAMTSLDADGPEVRDVVADPRFFAAALPLFEQFWLCVQRRTPPEADGKEGTTRALKRLWREASGETVKLGPDDVVLLEELERKKGEKKGAEGRIDELENMLRLRLGASTFGALPDGTFLVSKTVNVKGYTKAVEPFSYRKLTRWRPRVAARRRG